MITSVINEWLGTVNVQVNLTAASKMFPYSLQNAPNDRIFSPE